MRIGEILVGASLINTEQLDEALNYAAFKHVPVGRALRVLRYLSEDDLSRAVDAQKAIRKGLDASIALDVVRNSKTAGRTFNFTLETSALTIAVVPRVLIESILDKKLPRSLQQQLDAIQAKSGVVRRPAAQPAAGIPKPPTQAPTASPAAGTPGSQAAGSASASNQPAAAPMPPAPTARSTTTSIPSFSSKLPPEIPSTPPAEPTFAQPKLQLDQARPLQIPLPEQPQTQPVPGAAKNFQEALDKADKQFAANEVAAAEKSYRKALEYAETGYKPTNIGIALTKLANFYLSTDRLDEAAPLYERSMQIAQKVFGPGSPKLTRAQEDLAELYFLQGRLVDSRKMTEEALKNMRNEDTLDPQAAGRLLKRLLSISWRSGEPPARVRLGELAVDAFLITRDRMQQALQTSKQTGAPLGNVLRNMELLDEKQVESLMFAQLLIKQSTIPCTVAVHALRLAVAHRVPLRTLCDSAKFVTESQRNNEQYQELVVEQEKFLAAESRFGSDHPEVARCAEQLADMHRSRKDDAAAELLYKRAIGILEKFSSADKNALAHIYEKLADVNIQSGRHAQAQPLLFRSLELRQTGGSATTEPAAATLQQLAQIELAQYNAATALSFLRSARSIYEALSPGSTPRVVLEQIASCCLETGTLGDLEPVLEQLITQARLQGRATTNEIADYMEWLGDIYLAGGKHDEAVSQYALSLEIHQQVGSQTKAEVLAKKLAQSA